jgi:hypothetical protein
MCNIIGTASAHPTIAWANQIVHRESQPFPARSLFMVLFKELLNLMPKFCGRRIRHVCRRQQLAHIAANFVRLSDE